MRIGGTARIIMVVRNINEIRAAIHYARTRSFCYRVLGCGSNAIGKDQGFDGIIIINNILGFEVIEQTEECVKIRIGAGELLDEDIAQTVDMRLSGIEALSAIPGTVGAAPIQNAGAYGQEFGDHLESVSAIDTHTMEIVSLSKSQCGFKYRGSIFKNNNRRYVIVDATLVLLYANPEAPFYPSLQAYLDQRGITNYTPAIIRDAVTQIRKTRLPSPSILPNSGSFFKNPIVEPQTAQRLQEAFPEVPIYITPEGCAKIPAGWLIEQAGLKGYEHGALRIHDKNALVVVNTGKATYAELDELRRVITKWIKQKFGITLEQEPEELE